MEILVVWGKYFLGIKRKTDCMWDYTFMIWTIINLRYGSKRSWRFVCVYKRKISRGLKDANETKFPLSFNQTQYHTTLRGSNTLFQSYRYRMQNYRIELLVFNGGSESWPTAQNQSNPFLEYFHSSVTVRDENW
jgi:hypothetical protein